MNMKTKCERPTKAYILGSSYKKPDTFVTTSEQCFKFFLIDPRQHLVYYIKIYHQYEPIGVVILSWKIIIDRVINISSVVSIWGVP